MNFLLQVFVVCIFVTIAESAERVPRSIGYNCPRDIDFPKGMNCKKCVRYRRRGSKVTLRCPSGFSRYGNKRLICGKDGLWKGDFPLCVKSGCSPIHTPNDLNLVMSEHPKYSDAVITFQCEADSIMFGPTEIHCDGVNWSSPPPRCAAIEDLLSCDFEEDLCGWTQDSTVIGNQNWTRGIGPTMTGGTGPKRDHTHPNSDTGHYMFLETSSPTKEGDKAVLVSPMYTADFSPMCFEFWYHMLGPNDYGHVGSIDVYIKADSDQFAFLQPEFHKEGNQGDSWHKGDIFIDDQIESYQIMIVATKMKSYMSDLAIDDVRLYNCTQTTSSTTTTTLQTTTTPKPTPSPTVVSSELSTRQNISISTQYRDVSTVITNASQISGVVISTESPINSTGIVSNSTSVVTAVPTVGSTVVNSSEPKIKSSSSTSKPSTLGMNSTLASSSPVTRGVPTSSSPKLPTARVPVQSTTTTAPLSSSSAKPPTTSRPTTSTAVIPTVISTSKVTDITTVLTTKSTTTSAPQTTVIPKTSTSITSTRTSSTRPSTVKTTVTELTTSSTVITTSAKTRRTQVSTNAFSATARDSTTTVIQTTPSSSKTISSVQPVSSTVQESPKTSIQAATGLSTKSLESSTQNTTAFVKTTTKAIDKTNKGPDNNATVKAAISKHPEDDTLKPLMIGLGVGIIVGLVIIGIIVWACMRRRKFYTRGYEDELKPITNAASTQSLNNVDYYQDDFDIEHIQ